MGVLYVGVKVAVIRYIFTGSLINHVLEDMQVSSTLLNNQLPMPFSMLYMKVLC